MPRKTLLAGVIYFDQRKQSVNCVIRELSAGAATLMCENPRAVPVNVFELYIPNRNEVFAAAVKERTATELRVAFIQTGSAQSASSSEGGGLAEVFKRLQTLETEVKRLRHTVNELKDGRSSSDDKWL